MIQIRELQHDDVVRVNQTHFLIEREGNWISEAIRFVHLDGPKIYDVVYDLENNPDLEIILIDRRNEHADHLRKKHYESY